MGGTSKQTQDTTAHVSNSFDPWVTSAGSGLFQQASADVLNHPYQGYDGPTQGAFGEGTQEAQDYLSKALGTNGGVAADTTGASDAYKQIMASINPNASVSDYMSPYTAGVLAPTLRNINESADQARMKNGADATMAGQWGSSGMGLAQAMADRNRENSIGDATAAGYDKAFNSATSARDSALSKFLAAAQGVGAMGAQGATQGNTLATLLAGLGGQQQQANQTGINTAIGLNDQNQMGQTKMDTGLAQILAMIPKNTSGTQDSHGVTTTPDNSGIALLGSLLGAGASAAKFI